MCEGLGDFLRKTLRLGAREVRVRWRRSWRWSSATSRSSRCASARGSRSSARSRRTRSRASVPPLLLQPLVENAVKHGVADRVEGGTVRIEARVRPAAKDGVELLEIVVENPSDPTAPVKRGTGAGLDNVRRGSKRSRCVTARSR